MNNLLIVGAGGHGKVVVESASKMKQWDKIAFLDDNYKTGSQCNGYPILGKLSSCSELQNDYKYLFVAIGKNKLRLDYMKKFNSNNNLLLFWDEPTIGLDVESHCLHNII